jgi:hypothetical protein
MHSKTSIKRGRFLETSAAAIGVAAASYSLASAQTEAAATMSGAGKPSIVFLSWSLGRRLVLYQSDGAVASERLRLHCCPVPT